MEYILSRAKQKVELFDKWEKEPTTEFEVIMCNGVAATRNEYETARCVLPLGHFGSCYSGQ